jgi:hypothetical protein
MNQKAETFLNQPNWLLVEYFNSKEQQINRYWNSIKICIRNNYQIKDATIWFDTVRLLDHFDKDLLSTKYVCPDDLHKAHNKLVAKKRTQDELLRADLMVQNWKTRESIHKKSIFRYLFLQWQHHGKVIGSVQDWRGEN